MMNNSCLIRFALVAGVFCTLLPGRASSLGHAAPDDPPAADSVAVVTLDSLSGDAPFLLADPMPAFNGGDITAFCHWVQERLVYPDEAIESCIRGRVVIAFVVERDGTVGEVTTLVSPDRVLSEAAMRVVRQSPVWTPGMRGGEPVRVQFTIPIDFNVHAEAEQQVMPTFQGGDRIAFKRWVLRNLELQDDVFYPGDEGWVDAEFCVNKKGRVRKVDTPGFSDVDFANRISRAISSSPDWTPAEKPYDVYFKMRFNLLLHRTPEGLRSEDYTAYKQVDKLPLFHGRGSFEDFSDWVYKQVDSLLGPSVSAPPARIVVRFVVERDGTVTGIRVAHSMKHTAFSKLVRRAVDNIPLWSPAQLAGEKVRFQVTQILDFREAEKRPAKDSTAVFDVEPKFCGGGLMEFRRWVAETVRFPPEALEKKIRGRVVVSFVVDSEGSVTSVKVLQSPSPILSDEVERVLSSAPGWSPGMTNGESVPVEFTLPVDFNFESGKPWPVPGASFGSRTLRP